MFCITMTKHLVSFIMKKKTFVYKPVFKSKANVRSTYNFNLFPN